jgi:hypothetical protein
MITMIPNQTGSNPALNMTGATIGNVTTMMESVSMKHPRIR